MGGSATAPDFVRVPNHAMKLGKCTPCPFSGKRGTTIPAKTVPDDPYAR